MEILANFWALVVKFFSSEGGQTFLGAFLGVPTGLWVNHLWSRREGKAKKAQLVEAFKTTITKNISVLGPIEEYAKAPTGYPYFNVDLSLFESTSSLKYEVFDIGLCQQIDHARYELAHLERKLDLLLKLEFDASMRTVYTTAGTSMYDTLRPGLAGAIEAHIGPIRASLQSIETEIGGRAGWLRRIFAGRKAGGQPTTAPAPK